jgi:large subunit ribosomal protein L10
MNREHKTAVVDEIAEQIQASQAVFAVDYRGISVAQAAELRTRLREADARFRVVKNSLSERAADKAGAESLKPMLVGPTALTFVSGDAALAAKALNDAARQFNLLDFKGGILNGTTLSADDVRSIARLPSREVLNAQLVGTIAAPITGLVRTLNALIAGLAIQLQAIADMDPPVLGSGSPAAHAPADATEAAAPEGGEPAETPAEEAAESPAAVEASESPAADEASESPAAVEVPESPAAVEASEAPAAVEASEAPAAEAPSDEPETETHAASDAPSDE